MLGRLGLAEQVDAVVGLRRDDTTASLGVSIDVMVATQVVVPCAKLARSDGWQRPAGDRLVTLPAAALDHRKFGDALDQLSPAILHEIHRRVAAMLEHYDVDVAGLVLDTTNVVTCVDSANERNIIATAVATR